MVDKPKVCVLTSEHNLHDQQGEYFEAVFAKHPSVQTLADWLRRHGGYGHMDVMEAVSLIEHIRAGGGRRGTEDIWYNLKQEELQ